MQNFSLYRIVRLVIRNIFTLIITGVVFAAATFSYCKFLATPSYSARGSLLISNGAIITSYYVSDSGTLNNSDISASLNIITTVTDVLKTSGLYKELAKSLDNEYSYKQLASSALIRQRSDETLFIDVTFTAATPEEAVKITNKYLEIAPNYVNQFVPDSGSRVITYAEDASKKFPLTFSFTIIAFVIGVMIAFAIIFVINLFSTVVQSDIDFKDHFDIPVIGSIPTFSDAKSLKYHKKYYKNSYNNYYGGGNKNEEE